MMESIRGASIVIIIHRNILESSFRENLNSIVHFASHMKPSPPRPIQIRRWLQARSPQGTSIFEEPQDTKEIYEPEKGRGVQSKIEYILFQALRQSGSRFEYEEPLYLEKAPIPNLISRYT